MTDAEREAVLEIVTDACLEVCDEMSVIEPHQHIILATLVRRAVASKFPVSSTLTPGEIET